MFVESRNGLLGEHSVLPDNATADRHVLPAIGRLVARRVARRGTGRREVSDTDDGATNPTTSVTIGVDHDSAFYWEGARDGRLLAQRCVGCASLWHPPGPVCPHCQCLEWTVEDLALHGELYCAAKVREPGSPIQGTDYLIVLPRGQQRGFAVGMILAPDEILTDPHIVARGYPATVHQPQLGRSIVHAGLPIRFVGTPGAVRPAPAPREHQFRIDHTLAPAPDDVTPHERGRT